MATRRVLLVKNGTTADVVRVAHGDYDRWFLRSLRGVQVRVVQIHLGELPPARGLGFDAVIATGSPMSVTARAPWMARAAELLLEAAERVPVLGVCFGHQILAVALGGRVARSPAGREIGTVACALTPAGRADPLFVGIAPRFEVNATHEDEVVAAPPGIETLASNASTRIQAFRAGRLLWGVQFHPELDAATLGALVRSREALLRSEARARGEDPELWVRSVRAGLRETPDGRRILENFVAMA